MGEQERYKQVLSKVIDDTENHKIQSAEELVQILKNELNPNVNFKNLPKL